MIQYTKGDIFDSDAEAFVNPVNCVGVMGKGLALKFKILYPDNFNAYKIMCDKGMLKPGYVITHTINQNRYEGSEYNGNPKYIINFPTKDHWKDPSTLEYIESGLKALINIVDKNNIKSVAVPPLGCGLGGLNWDDVNKLFHQYLKDVDSVDFIIYEP